MRTQKEKIDLLIEIIGQDCVQEHDLFGVCLKPRSTEQVSQALRYCHQNRLAVIPVGGDSNVVGSTKPERKEIGLSLERLNQIENVDVANRTLLAQSGVILENAQLRAEENNLQLALDFGARGSATLGGCIATNAGGNRVIRYGMTREQILGLEVVLADGTIVDSLSDTLKNNTGYDLKQWFIGAEGTLGVVTKSVWRLRPAYASRQIALVGVASFDKLSRLLSKVDEGAGGLLSAFEVMWDNYYDWVLELAEDIQRPLQAAYPYYALIELQGSDAERDRLLFEALLQECLESELICDAVLANSESQRAKLWAVRDGVSYLLRLAHSWIFDVSLAVDKMDAFCKSVEQTLSSKFASMRLAIFGHMGDGNLHLLVQINTPDENVDQLLKCVIYDAVGVAGGSISAEHGIGLDKREYLNRSRSDVEIKLMQQMKRMLDPHNILNPGKIFSLNK